MAKYRMVELESDADWGDSGTKIIDLDFVTPITQLHYFGTFLAGTTTWAKAPAENITKIEITDGSEILFSGTGMAVKGHYMRSTGKSPVGYQYLRNGKSVGVDITINFGRFFGDRKYAFDPTKFKNPQLKITWNEDLHCATTTSNSQYVQAILFNEDPPAPVGFLRLFEVEAYNPGASSWHVVDLPTDKITRQVYFNALKAHTALGTTMNYVKLTEDGDVHVPYDDYAYKIFRQVNLNSPVFHEQFRILITTSLDYMFTHIGSINGSLGCQYDANGGEVGPGASQGGAVSTYVEAAGTINNLRVEGYNPCGMFDLPICDYADDTLWFDARKLGTWQIKLQAGSAAASTDTFRVYVEQLYEY